MVLLLRKFHEKPSRDQCRVLCSFFVIFGSKMSKSRWFDPDEVARMLMDLPEDGYIYDFGDFDGNEGR